MKILLGENDADHLDLTAYALRRQGFRVSMAMDGKAILAKWRAEDPDLILLNTALPKLSGVEVCRQVREESQVPVLFLSERTTDQDVVGAFDAGADDYIVKPFSHRQLIARIGAALRRASNGRARNDGFGSSVTAGNLTIDVEEHKVMVGRHMIHATPLEFRLLYCLASNKGHLVTTGRLIDYAWGTADGGDARVLKTHLSHIRRKLEAADPDFNSLKSVSGVGYLLEDQGLPGRTVRVSFLNPGPNDVHIIDSPPSTMLE